jgi:hypothetical protein
MANVSKMSELQDALNRCGYLGEAGNASGVPPAGDWMSDGRDYRDAKFSTYWEGALKVGTISMGLAVRIPHTKDDGAFYLRVVLDFLVEGHTFSVQIGDGKIIWRATDRRRTIGLSAGL